MLRWLARHRRPVQAAVDAGAWAMALFVANCLRYDFTPPQFFSSGLAYAFCVAVATQLIAGISLHLYRGRYRFGSFEETLGVSQAVFSAAVVLGLVNLVRDGALWIPRSVPAFGGILALMLMVTCRYAWRLFLESQRRPDQAQAEPLLVFGAGEAADQVIGAMLRDPKSAYYPVGVLDDDSKKRNLRIRGVRVLGDRNALASAARNTGARMLLFAIPSADSATVRDISDLAAGCGMVVKVLPGVSELFGEQVGLTDIRDLDIADLLGRRQVELDLEEIAALLTGKRVLVTGAGGSIGSELCRQLAQFSPAKLVMLDRDESSLHAVQLSIAGRALLEGDDLVLADIRDIQHVMEIFADCRPEVVFHTAALKHLSLLERFPGEAVKTNVWGTLSILEAAEAAGVETFINISTDKAAEPASVLGFSKKITERLTAHFASATQSTYISVRFGNVLGSRGSVMTAFATQAAAGGPLTVTHPDVTRYFMTIQEAVHLVLQAAAVGSPGEVLVLDMGAPVLIADVARQFAARAGGDVGIEFTGLRAGEKLHERLLATNEADKRPNHPLISEVPATPLHPNFARELDPWNAPELLIADMADMASRDDLTSQSGRRL